MIRTFDSPEGVKMSDKYTVTVKNTNKKFELPVYAAYYGVPLSEEPVPDDLKTEFNGVATMVLSMDCFFSCLEADENAELDITYHGNTNGLIIKGSKCLENSGNHAVVVMQPNDKLEIRTNDALNEGYHNSLRIFCDMPGKIESIKENLIEFFPGIYTAENSEYITVNEHGFPVIKNIPDHTTVYIHKGAVVNAAIVLDNAADVEICGGGIVSGYDRCCNVLSKNHKDMYCAGVREFAVPQIYIKNNSKNITVKDVVLNCEFRGITVRNSEDILIDNVKILSSSVNADGINIINTRRLLAKNCYVHSADDCFAIFNSCDSIQFLADDECKNPVFISSDIEICDSVLITRARPFCIGGHASGATNPRCLLQNVKAQRLDITRMAYCTERKPNDDEQGTDDIRFVCSAGKNEYEKCKFWSGIIRVLSQSEQLVRNIVFKDMTLSQPKNALGRPIHIEVRGDKFASYTEKGGYKIENIKFENLAFENGYEEVMLPIYIGDTTENKSDAYGIENITFSNVTFAGEKADNSEKMLETAGNVKKIVFN